MGPAAAGMASLPETPERRGGEERGRAGPSQEAPGHSAARREMGDEPAAHPNGGQHAGMVRACEGVLGAVVEQTVAGMRLGASGHEEQLGGNGDSARR